MELKPGASHLLHRIRCGEADPITLGCEISAAPRFAVDVSA